MATLLLPAIAGFSAGSTWWYIATAVGMYIDSAYTFPTLFGQDPVHGPKLEDQPVARWSEGTPIPRVFGGAARVPGQVLWQSPLKEVKEEESGGGKGGGGGAFVTYKYYTHVAVAFCAGPVDRVKKVWADGKTVYNVAPDIDYTSTQIAGAITTSTPYQGPIIYWLTLTSSGSSDLSLIKSGKQLQITAPGDPGTAAPYALEVAYSDTDLLTGVTTCRCRATSGWSDWSAGGQVILHQDLPTHSTKHFQSIRFHMGGADQEPDSMIETYHGVGEVPGFRGIVYIVLDELALFDFGNRIPSFSALIEEDEDRKLHEAMENILLEGDLDPGEFDLTDLEDADLPLLGYAIPGPQETLTSLQPLLVQHDVLAQQKDSSIRFFRRKNARIVDVDAEDLACYVGRPPRTPVEVSEIATSQLPNEINVDYLDSNNEYNKGSQRQRRNDNLSRASSTINLPVVMETNEARAVASRMLWAAWTSRHKLRFTLPATKYADKLREADVARFTALGETWEVLVTKIDRGVNLLMDIEAQVENLDAAGGFYGGEDVLFSTDGGSGPGGHMTQNPSFYTPRAKVAWWECRPLKENHTRRPGFYIACCSADSRYSFTGASLFESLNGEDGPYSKVAELHGSAFMGEATSYTGATAYHGRWDHANTIRVEFEAGTPSSVTELEVLNGSNRAVFGREIIAFQTATLVSGKTYDLTKLMRGLRGTEAHINDATHGARDQFVLLNQPSVHFHELPASAINTTRHYKVVGAGLTVEATRALPLTIEALNVKPLAPIITGATRDGSNNVTVSWISRSRGLARILGPATSPAYERKEEYTVVLRDPADSADARKLTATEAKSTEISAAQQVSAGYVAGSTIKVVVEQFSEYHRTGTPTGTTAV